MNFQWSSFHNQQSTNPRNLRANSVNFRGKIRNEKTDDEGTFHSAPVLALEFVPSKTASKCFHCFKKLHSKCSHCKNMYFKLGCTVNNAFSEVWNKLKGSLLQGSFDKRVRIDLPVPLPVPTQTPLPPHPIPLFLISTGKPTPTHLTLTSNPSPRKITRSSHIFEDF